MKARHLALIVALVGLPTASAAQTPIDLGQLDACPTRVEATWKLPQKLGVPIHNGWSELGEELLITWGDGDDPAKAVAVGLLSGRSRALQVEHSSVRRENNYWGPWGYPRVMFDGRRTLIEVWAAAPRVMPKAARKMRRDAPAGFVATRTVSTEDGWVFFGVQNGPDGLPDLQRGYLYAPASGWEALPHENAPASRTSATMAAVGGYVVVWSGRWGPREKPSLSHERIMELDDIRRDGGRLELATKRWRPVSARGAPAARRDPMHFVFDDKLFVIGGKAAKSAKVGPVVGGIYDPKLDRWQSTPSRNAPTEEHLREVLRWSNAPAGGLHWTGRFLVFLRLDAGERVLHGHRFDPKNSMWTRLPPIRQAPVGETHVLDAHRVVILDEELGNSQFAPSPSEAGLVIDLTTRRACRLARPDSLRPHRPRVMAVGGRLLVEAQRESGDVDERPPRRCPPGAPCVAPRPAKRAEYISEGFTLLQVGAP